MVKVLDKKNSTVPFKSTRKATVVLGQGLSVSAALVAAIAFLRAKGWVPWSEDMDLMFVGAAAPTITAALHGLWKQVCHQLRWEIDFKVAPKGSCLLLFFLGSSLLLMPGCAMMRQVSKDSDTKYTSTGIAFGKANIQELRTSFRQVVVDGEGSSETEIGQQSNEVVAEGDDIVDAVVPIVEVLEAPSIINEGE